MQRVRCFDVTDVHIGGEVHRIILNGVAPVPGESLREQARFLEQQADGLRQLLLYEPRGGLPSLSADLVVEPKLAGAEAAIIIMEFMGYPLYSGSNIMASVIALLDAGRLAVGNDEQTITLESPGGLAEVVVESREGRVVNTTYAPSTVAYVSHPHQDVEVPGYGTVRYDMVWSGVFYAVIDAAAHGFSLLREEEERLRNFGSAFVEAARPGMRPTHPQLGDMGPLSFALLTGPAVASTGHTLKQRVASYVHPRSVCRCPSGTGTTAAMTQLASQGRLGEGDRLLATSWFGSSFVGVAKKLVVTDGEPGLEVAEAVTKLGFGKFTKKRPSKWPSHAHVSGLRTANSVRFCERAHFEIPAGVS